MMSTGDAPSNGSDEAGGLSAPLPALPKGGGAIRGIGESFAVNPSTGTGSTSIPIVTSPGRSGFGPRLALAYDSGSGNSPFGLGWSLSLPAIARKTEKGLPRYRDEEESDTFVLSGSEDLVPELALDGSRWEDRSSVPGFCIHRYRPRIEGPFARIERWTRLRDGDVHWRSTSGDAVLTIYGLDARSRITDPADGRRVFSWLVSEMRDDRGNAVLFGYKAEDGADAPLHRAHQSNRGDEADARRSANRYPKRILYGNRTPLLDAAGRRPQTLTTAQVAGADWMFEVVFDYGEHDLRVPMPNDPGRWSYRADSYSSYRAGFEVRTCRRCRRVLMFHHFDKEPGVGLNCLVRSTDFLYSDELDPGSARNPAYSYLCSATQAGYRRSAGTYVMRTLPPVEFAYSEPTIQDEVREVDPESVANIPAGLDGEAYSWTDLHGEGIPGILTEAGTAWYYKRNLTPLNRVQENGSARFEAKFAPLERAATKPNLVLSGGAAQFMDLEGDGTPHLVVLDGPMSGYYEHDEGEGWGPFVPFRGRLNRDTRDRFARLIDLDGDGRADLLFAEADEFAWHALLGEDGFGPEFRVPQPTDEERGPKLIFGDGTESIYLADLSGDGLTDLVRIRAGEVCYWPNLGYGRFGAMVTMDDAPQFDHPDQFDGRRIRLADIDGSGTTDIIYLHRDGVRLYFNQCGNGWGQAVTLSAFPRVDALAQVTAIDLLGNGTSCLVWSSPQPGDARLPMRYIDLMGSIKPHLLVSISNNLGSEMWLDYASSTRFYLEDKRDGRPWITRLPFPVQVVERVTTIDSISGSRFVTRHAYHHGFFDGEEREFRGFGMVEQWDSEMYGGASSGGAPVQGSGAEAASDVPPKLTKTWFHTGVFLGRDRVSRYFAGFSDAQDVGEYYRRPGATQAQAAALLLPDTVLPDDLTADEEREACRALKGMMLRQEIYGQDGTDHAAVPYVITEQNFTVRRLQARGANRHAIFFAHPREALTYQHERNADDPRVAHSMKLDVDRFGNIRREMTIGYGRSRSTLAERRDRDRQTTSLVTITERGFTNAIDDDALYPGEYRAPLPAEQRIFELTGFAPPSGAPRLRFEDWERPGSAPEASASIIPYEQDADGASRQKRLVEHTRTRYRADDMRAQLPVGQLQPRAIPGQSFRLALTPGVIATAFVRPRAGQSDEALLPSPGPLLEGKGEDQGGYVAWDGGWWIPSGRAFFSPAVNVVDPSLTAAAERAAARAGFFLHRSFADPFDHTTTVEYDAHNLLVTRTRDSAGNEILAGGDYRVLQPALVTDANGNRAAAAFDALGMVCASALMGKVTESIGDLLEGFDPDPPLADLQSFAADPEARAASMLGKATTRIVYDLGRYQRCGQPPFAATLAREVHLHQRGGTQSRIQTSINYSDGFARIVQRKVQAEAGPAPARSAPTTLPSGDMAIGSLVFDAQHRLTSVAAQRRWTGTGRTVFNNKGLPVREYEPFFSAEHLYEPEPEMTDTGVSSVRFYDPTGRVVATLHPDHGYEKIVFDAWQQTTHDASDTVGVDPSVDADMRGFLLRPDGTPRIARTEYLPTWHALRTDPANAAEAARRWPDARLRDAERSAAQQAAAHAGTPTTAHLDALGRVFLSIADNGPDPAGSGPHQLVASRVERDIEGVEREVRDAIVQNGDALGRIVMRYRHDLAGVRLRQSSMEAGERWTLNDATGKPIREWDSRGTARRIAYDALRRRTKLLATDGAGERLAERMVYGEAQGDAANHRSRVHRVFDGAGVATSVAYDFKGNLLQSRRELLTDHALDPDWQSSPPPGAAGGTYVTTTEYDALNRPQRVTSPDGSVCSAAFNKANRLESVAVQLRGATTATNFVTNIDYDAKGQRQLIEYGNGVSTEYEYDPLTYRLTRLRTTRPSGVNGVGSAIFIDPAVVQDLRYTSDASGNITRIEDAALKTVHHAGRQVTPVATFVYDAMHRLLEATGREHIGQNAFEPAPPGGNYRDHPFVGSRAHPNDLGALRQYAERYEIDAAGNLQSLRHLANGGDWTRIFSYDEASLNEPSKRSNRLSGTTLSAGTVHAEPCAHDAHGNIVSMPHVQGMAWDHKDQLRKVTLRNGGVAFYACDSDGQRIRKVVAAPDGTPASERVSLGAFEVYREFAGPANQVAKSRETFHVMDAAQRVAVVDTLTAANGTPIQVPQPAIRYQLANHLGSASVELDANASLISYEEYHPYGTTAFQAARSAAEASLKRYRSGGKERDEETGFSYHGARYLAPWLARWTSCDPLAPASGLNCYVAMAGNPVRMSDPDGRADRPARPPGAPAKPRGASAKPPPKVMVINGEVQVEGFERVRRGNALEFRARPGGPFEGSAKFGEKWTFPDGAVFEGSPFRITTEGALSGIGLPDLVRAEQVAKMIAQGDPVTGIDMTFVEPKTAGDLAAGKSFSETWGGKHVEYFLQANGLEIEPGTLKVTEVSPAKEYHVSAKVAPAKPAPAKSTAAPKPAIGDLVLTRGAGVVGGGLGALMTYTAMKEAEMQAEEEDSFEPIKNETIRQVGGLAGGIAFAEAGAAIGLPAGPAGIAIGAVLGFVGGFIGYHLADPTRPVVNDVEALDPHSPKYNPMHPMNKL